MTGNGQTREVQRTAFLRSAGWNDSVCEALIPDASFRCYFKVSDGQRRAVLMDAPPEHERIEPFLKVTFHLQKLGIRVPDIYHSNLESGFILLEDLGNDTLTDLLDGGSDEPDLYRRAMDTIMQVQAHPESTQLDLEQYDFDHFMDEADLMTHWYLPAVIGDPLPASTLHGYRSAWESVFSELPELPPTLVLRDFHVDNLMLVEGRCALLDYQDALIGSPAYDVVSLLEDARRDIPTEIIDQCLEAYRFRFPRIDPEDFDHHYRVWGAQRHAKVLGIFVRLWLRDNKPAYRRHLPRVWQLLTEGLESQYLAPLRRWFADNTIGPKFREIELDRNHLRESLELDRQST